MAKGKGRRLARGKDKHSVDRPPKDDDTLEIWDPELSDELDELPREDEKSKAIEKGGSFLLTDDNIRDIKKCLVLHQYYWEVVVLSIDIRKSSVALTYAEDFYEFSRALTDLVCYIENNWRARKGRFFDKFTGDGALCFWTLPSNPEDSEDEKMRANKALIRRHYIKWNLRIKETIDFGVDVICKFMEIALPRIRKTCGLIPSGYGISVGIDAGECLLTELTSSTKEEAPQDSFQDQYGPIKRGLRRRREKHIQVSDNLTMLGRPVIGATRMVDAAEPYEILVNCYPGSALKARIDDPNEHEIHENLYFGLDLDFRKVQEYCYGPVEVYRVITDRIEHLKRELGLVEKDEDGSKESKKDTKEFICKPAKSKQKRTK